jgi:phosphoglycolate phosphatase-like HAD superfamily hydrolase
MGLRAREEFPDINFEEALMVGDSKSDIEFGKNLGMQTALIHGKEDEAAFWETSAMQPDHRFHSLKELADWLQNLTKTPPQ